MLFALSSRRDWLDDICLQGIGCNGAEEESHRSMRLERIGEVEVVMTVVGGREVHLSGRF